MAVSVAVPVRNAAGDLEVCLTALGRSSLRPMEVIVVDDASTDGSAAVAERHGAQVLQLSQQSGPAAARNAAAAVARGDLLVFVDADVCVRPDTLQQLARLFERDTALAAAFGSYDDAPAHPGFLSQYKNLLHHFTHQNGRPEASTFWTGCGAIRREVFLRLGGFDESYRLPSVEDIELGYRLRAARLRVRLAPAIQVQHRKRWRWRALLASDVLFRALPWARLIRRHRSMPDDLNVRTSQRAAVVLAGLAVLLLVAAAMAAGTMRYALGSAGLALVAATAALNLPLLRFLGRVRGFGFAAASFGVYFVSLLYSGLAFAAAMITPERRAGAVSTPARAEPDHAPETPEEAGVPR